MTRAKPSVVHRKDNEAPLLGEFLRLSVDDPLATKKAREDLFKSIAKSDRILQALIKLVKTHGSERAAEKRRIVGVLTDAQTQLLRANHLVSVGIQRVLREIEVGEDPPYSKWSDPTRKRAKRVREALEGKTTSKKAKTDAK